MGAPKIGGPSSAPPSLLSTPTDIETVTVKPHEGWKDIAERFGISVRELKDANPGVHALILRTGTELTIPKAKGKGPAEGAGDVEVGASGAEAGAAKKGEVAAGEKAKAAGLHAQVEPPSGELKATEGTLTAKSKGKEKEIKELQHDLNEWGKNQDPPIKPIKENGVYDDATLKAVKKFQEKSEFSVNGKADPITRDVLKLEINPNYKDLNIHTKQNFTEGALRHHSKDPLARTEIMDIVTDPNFSKLDAHEKKAIFEFIGGDYKITESTSEEISARMKAVVDLKEDKSFASIKNEDVRKGLTDGILTTGNKDLQDALVAMGKDDGFAKLPSSVQQRAGSALYNNFEKPGFTENLTDLVTSKAFEGMSETDQKEVLDWITKYPDARFVQELEELSGKKLAKLDERDVTKILDGLGIKHK